MVVAYADAAKANAPPVDEVVAFATEKPGRVLLIDTFAKGPPRRTLLDWLGAEQVRAICQRCHAAEGRVERAWYAVRTDGHAAKVLAELGASA